MPSSLFTSIQVLGKALVHKLEKSLVFLSVPEISIKINLGYQRSMSNLQQTMPFLAYQIVGYLILSWIRY